jgi:hypothetical protein
VPLAGAAAPGLPHPLDRAAVVGFATRRPVLVRRGSDGSVVSGGIRMSGSHTAGKLMLVQGGLIQSDFRKREEEKLAAIAF